MTRYASRSPGPREAKNELKAGLFGSDESVSSTMSRPVAISWLEGMSASEMRDLKSGRRFP